MTISGETLNHQQVKTSMLHRTQGVFNGAHYQERIRHSKLRIACEGCSFSRKNMVFQTQDAF